MKKARKNYKEYNKPHTTFVTNLDFVQKKNCSKEHALNDTNLRVQQIIMCIKVNLLLNGKQYQSNTLAT